MSVSRTVRLTLITWRKKDWSISNKFQALISLIVAPRIPMLGRFAYNKPGSSHTWHKIARAPLGVWTSWMTLICIEAAERTKWTGENGMGPERHTKWNRRIQPGSVRIAEVMCMGQRMIVDSFPQHKQIMASLCKDPILQAFCQVLKRIARLEIIAKPMSNIKRLQVIWGWETKGSTQAKWAATLECWPHHRPLSRQCSWIYRRIRCQRWAPLQQIYRIKTLYKVLDKSSNKTWPDSTRSQRRNNRITSTLWIKFQMKGTME